MNPFLWLLFGLAAIIIVLVVRCAYQFGKLLEFADRERDLSLDGRVEAGATRVECDPKWVS